MYPDDASSDRGRIPVHIDEIDVLGKAPVRDDWSTDRQECERLIDNPVQRSLDHSEGESPMTLSVVCHQLFHSSLRQIHSDLIYASCRASENTLVTTIKRYLSHSMNVLTLDGEITTRADGLWEVWPRHQLRYSLIRLGIEFKRRWMVVVQAITFSVMSLVDKHSRERMGNLSG